MAKSDGGGRRVLEFYSGIGGMRYSLMKAGVNAQVMEAFEINDIANDVYQFNFRHRPYQGNIQSLTAADLDKYAADAWLLSPPCQPYTRQGLQKDTGDARAFSFLQILELIPFLLQPPSMLFVENVVGFETSDTHAKLIEILGKTNFITQEFILSPLQFGIPYSRPRYFCLAKRKPSSFVNEVWNSQLIQSPRPLFEPFDTVANDGDLSQEDGLKLFQSCQPIENFLELKNTGNDIDVESVTSVTGLSNDVECDSLDQYYVPSSLVERWGSAMDVVYLDSKRCCCFTKSYYRYVKGTGSLLATVEPKKRDKASLKEQRLRYFTPREVANLHSFPEDFEFPEHISLRQWYVVSFVQVFSAFSDETPYYCCIISKYLIRHHSDQLRSIASSPDPNLHFPLFLDFAEFMADEPRIASLLFFQPNTYFQLFDDAALWAHKIIFSELFTTHNDKNVVEKNFIHVRVNIFGSPLECPETFPSIGRVRVQHRGILLTLKGTVIRSGATKMHEGERKYICQKCQNSFTVYPEVEARNSIQLPSICPTRKSKPCGGTKFQFVENTIVCHDYQEIKIQESTQVLGVGAIPRSILVILKDDLVDIVKAGDDVIVTGLLTAKWSPELKDVRCDLDPVLIANNIRRTKELKSDIDISDDIVMKFKQFWDHYKDAPLKGRNAILRGVCPQVFGLFTVKLAVALTLIGGVQHVDASGTRVRGESHLLLVGDPGTGKSQFLKFAAKLSNRSVITTGLGSTSAGLTVTAVKDGGEWVLEAGALVLADGGLCCIDEFDSMREHDRATIHEAMEQQTISVAKAGLVTTLSTKTTVFGATNPKGHYDPDQPLSVNTTLSGPLISRFDIVLVLLDTKNPEWDVVVSSHILSEAEPDRANNDEDLANIWPLSTLKRYINYVKENFRPILTREAEIVISCYYQLQRKSATDNAARTTVRMLESLIRLAQAHARLMFRNEVTRLDAVTAILCIESSMTTSAIVDCMGNALHSNFTENPDQEYVKQEKLILEKLGSIDDFSHMNNMED